MHYWKITTKYVENYSKRHEIQICFVINVLLFCYNMMRKCLAIRQGYKPYTLISK